MDQDAGSTFGGNTSLTVDLTFTQASVNLALAVYQRNTSYGLVSLGAVDTPTDNETLTVNLSGNAAYNPAWPTLVYVYRVDTTTGLADDANPYSIAVSLTP